MAHAGQIVGVLSPLTEEIVDVITEAHTSEGVFVELTLIVMVPGLFVTQNTVDVITKTRAGAHFESKKSILVHQARRSASPSIS